MDGSSTALLAISGAASAACWIGLWRGDDSLWAKLGWTFLAAVPVFGPVLYAGVHRAPPVSDHRSAQDSYDSVDPPDVGPGGSSP